MLCSASKGISRRRSPTIKNYYVPKWMFTYLLLLLELRAGVTLCCINQESPGTSILGCVHPALRVLNLQESQVGHQVVNPAKSRATYRSSSVGRAQQDTLHKLVVWLPSDLPCPAQALGSDGLGSGCLRKVFIRSISNILLGPAVRQTLLSNNSSWRPLKGSQYNV